MENSPLAQVPTPSYVIDLEKLKQNLQTLRYVADQSGCRILLAQKAFSAYDTYALIGEYLDGTAASGIYEARLGAEYMPHGEVHVFSPAYRDEEFVEVLGLANTIVFNSFSQWLRFKPLLEQHIADERPPVSVGLRINPLYSEVEVDIYNPAAPGSRLGVTLDAFNQGMLAHGLEGLEGIHFHALCEDSAETLERTLEHVYRQYLPILQAWPGGLKWFNLGGGHHVTRDGYNIDLLIRLLKEAKEKTGAQIYIEPGEAIALNAGHLVSTVLDIGKNELDFAILDTSVVCHMPDVLEMPYRPRCHVLYQDGREAEGLMPGEAAYTYRLGGPTCLAGDVVGEYAFPEPLNQGDRIIFHDMAIYTMVKTNTFNGMPLPAIVTQDGEQTQVLRTFSYEDFKMRLGS
jgi:carboxynorspermidine decarboxylase